MLPPPILTLPHKRGREVLPAPTLTLPHKPREHRRRKLGTEPLRTCVGCRKVKPRSELQRLAAVDGTLILNPRRVAGRSAYLCPNPECWTVAQKRRAGGTGPPLALPGEEFDPPPHGKLLCTRR